MIYYLLIYCFLCFLRLNLQPPNYLKRLANVIVDLLFGLSKNLLSNEGSAGILPLCLGSQGVRFHIQSRAVPLARMGGGRKSIYLL